MELELKTIDNGCVSISVENDVVSFWALGEGEFGGYGIDATKEDAIKFLEDSIKLIKQQ